MMCTELDNKRTKVEDSFRFVSTQEKVKMKAEKTLKLLKQFRSTILRNNVNRAVSTFICFGEDLSVK